MRPRRGPRYTRLFTARPDSAPLGPWTGFAVLAGFAGAVCLIALLRFHTRDV